MRTWNTWMAGLSAAALGLAMAGCGGSSGPEEEMVVDMSDPSFTGPQGGGGGMPGDAQAPEPAPAEAGPAPAEAGPAPGEATASAPSLVPRGGDRPAMAPRGEPQPQPQPRPAMAPRGGSEQPQLALQPRNQPAPAPAVAAEPNQPGLAPEAAGTEANSDSFALNEMLAAANAANRPPAPASRDGGQGRGSAGPGGGSGMMPGDGSMEAQYAAMEGGYGGTSGGYGAPMPGDSGDTAAAYDENMEAAYAQDMAGTSDQSMEEMYAESMPDGAGYPGMQGGFGPGAGRGGGSGEEVDFSEPVNAVEAFLAAAEDRNLQALHEATALRAPYEAESEANRKIFQAIRELALTPEELDTIASGLEGYKVTGMNQVRSTGTLSFTVRKPGENNNILQRTILVRKEKAGWKVKDVSGVSEIKQLGGRLYNRNRDRN